MFLPRLPLGMSACALAMIASAASSQSIVEGPAFSFGLSYDHYLGNVDFSGRENERTRERETIGTEWAHAARASLGLSYGFATARLGMMEVGVDSSYFLVEDFVDDDRIAGLSLYLRGERFGELYFGNTGGAAGRVAPPRAGGPASASGTAPIKALSAIGATCPMAAAPGGRTGGTGPTASPAAGSGPVIAPPPGRSSWAIPRPT